jgi:two-component system, response regulator
MPQNSRRSILLVEDDPDDEALTLRALRQARICEQVVVARDGAEAVKLLLQGSDVPSDNPTVVLLDLKLPRLSGFDVLRRLRADARTRQLPVVVLTSSGEQRDIVESYALGANSYVRKPVQANQFQAVIGAIGLYWLSLNQVVAPERIDE